MTKQPANPRLGRLKLPPLRVLFPALVFGTILGAFLWSAFAQVEDPLPPYATDFGDDQPAIELELGQETLSGQVLDTNGQPAPDVLVELLQGDRPHWDNTDELGRFELSGLFAGVGEVLVSAVGRPHMKQRVTIPAGDLVWNLPPLHEAIEFLPQMLALELFGQFRSDEEDLSGFELVLDPMPGQDLMSGLTSERLELDEDGNFHSRDLIQGSYIAYVLPPWAVGGSWPRLAQAEWKHTTRQGGGSGPLILTAKDAVLEVKLSDSSGEAVEGALVLLRDRTDPNRIWPPAIGTPEGLYITRHLPAGQYTLQVVASEFDILRELTLEADTTTQLAIQLDSD